MRLKSVWRVFLEAKTLKTLKPPRENRRISICASMTSFIFISSIRKQAKGVVRQIGEKKKKINFTQTQTQTQKLQNRD